ncbi:MAG: hypothetical protein KAG12_09235, partial [Desulfuromusa sp.]|nr:hypothetical protein [Desulfuromusa sp.]
MRIIIATVDVKLRDFCLQQLSKHDVDCDTVRTLGELFEELQKRRYSGLMIDLAASIKAGVKEKSKAHEILPLYPVLRLKW